MNMFSENLKKLRKEKGISQDELALKVSVHKTHISRYERGLAAPSIEVAQKIAECLGTSLDFLVSDTLTNKADKKLSDSELLNLFERVQILDEKTQQTIKEFLSAFVFKTEVKGKLAN